MPKNIPVVSNVGPIVTPLPVRNSALSRAVPENVAPTSVPRKTKSALLRDMILQPAGVSLQAIMAATGWQAHTVRAALSGLHKGGLELVRTASEAGTVYTASAAVDAAIKSTDDKGPKTPARDRNPAPPNGGTPASASTADATTPDVPL